MRWKIAASVTALAALSVAAPQPALEAGPPTFTVTCYLSVRSRITMWEIPGLAPTEVAAWVRSCPAIPVVSPD